MIGFIGLGVMGEPMCRNLAKKSGEKIVAFDTRAEPLAALAKDGVDVAASAIDVAQRADVVFLSLPGEPQVRAVCLGEGGLVSQARPGQTIVDCSTSPVPLARELGAAFGARARPSRTRPSRARRRRPGTAR